MIFDWDDFVALSLKKVGKAMGDVLKTYDHWICILLLLLLLFLLFLCCCCILLCGILFSKIVKALSLEKVGATWSRSPTDQWIVPASTSRHDHTWFCSTCRKYFGQQEKVPALEAKFVSSGDL